MRVPVVVLSTRLSTVRVEAVLVLELMMFRLFAPASPLSVWIVAVEIQRGAGTGAGFTQNREMVGKALSTPRRTPA